MGDQVLHFEIISRDNDKAIAFYSGLFGWKIDADNPFNYGRVYEDDNGGGIGGGLGAAMGDSPGYVTVYVDVPDVEEALARAESLGAERVMGPDEIMPGFTIGIFADPEGKKIGVMHMDEEQTS